MIEFLLVRLMRVPKPRQWVVLQLFSYSFLLAAAYQMGRTSADSSFLARLGIVALPAVFLASGVVVALAATTMNLLARRFSHRSVSTGGGVVLGLCTMLTALLLPEFHHSPLLIGAIYLLAEVRGTLGAISINWATHERLPRDSRFSFAAIGLSVPIAGILMGLIMGFSNSLHAQFWLLLAGGLDLVAVVPLWLQRTLSLGPTSSASTVQRRLSIRRLLLLPFRPHENVNREGVQLAQALVGLTYFKFLVLAIVAFEWKRYANVFFGVQEQELISYFSLFYAVTHTTSLILQGLVAGQLLERRLIQRTLMLMPLVLLTLAGVLIFFHSPMVALVVLTASKGMDAWRRSVEDTGMIMLVSRVPKQIRTSLISLNAGIVKPAAEILAAVVIWLLSYLSGDWVVWVWLVGTCLWSAWTWAAVRQPT